MALKEDWLEGIRPNCALPLELAFLKKIPELEKMDGDEIHAWMEARKTLIRQHAVLMRDYGMEAEKVIAFLEPAVRELEQAARKRDEALLKQFHAAANIADASHNIFKAMDRLAASASRSNPDHPQLQKLKQFLDAWRKHMPKE